MSPRVRILTIALLAIATVAAAAALSGLPFGGTAAPGSSGAGTSGTGQLPAASDSGAPEPTIVPTPTPRPQLGGTELYGYLPYWQMNDTMVTYLRGAPLTTLVLFSVTARKNGAIDTRPLGYRRIHGPIGHQLIDEAHARGARVDLVFSSFGAATNAQLFGRVIPPPTASPGPEPSPGASSAAPPAASFGPSAVPGGPATESPPSTVGPPPVPPWHRTVDELVALATELRVDGLNVDIELLADEDRAAYGEFLGALRASLQASNPKAQLSVATEAGDRGVANAVEATAAGVDRLFLMGYEYHWSGSAPGASAPIDRLDGQASLRWSIDQYVEAGVPRDRILLGLPLYGMQWRTTGPFRVDPVVGKGITWIPNKHLDLLLDPSFQPTRDTYEQAEHFEVPDGAEWLLTYFDSPATLRLKLALARDNGLAGAGFWAMGYERGLPGYLELMRAFRAGEVGREESPPRPSPAPSAAPSEAPSPAPSGEPSVGS